MGQFYASLETGHTTASVALKRLASFSPKNQFYRANRELGRVFKTEFILHYNSDASLRHRIQRGLLKGEQLHELARAVFYGKQGKVSARDLQQQTSTASCLTLILACIVYWQAQEIGRVFTQHDPQADGIDAALLSHISPVAWDNVIGLANLRWVCAADDLGNQRVYLFDVICRDAPMPLRRILRAAIGPEVRPDLVVAVEVNAQLMAFGVETFQQSQTYWVFAVVLRVVASDL